jgi:hypothetical protein
MEAETHFLHTDLVRLVYHGRIGENPTTFQSAFKALRYTSPAKLFNLQQQPSFPTDLLVTTDFMRTVKIPPGPSRVNFILDSYQRPVKYILITASLERADITRQAIIISPFKANRLLPII